MNINSQDETNIYFSRSKNGPPLSDFDASADISADWVVLPEERQWGCICVPPGNIACCELVR